jgi:hypothetical protein
MGIIFSYFLAHGVRVKARKAEDKLCGLDQGLKARDRAEFFKVMIIV